MLDRCNRIQSLLLGCLAYLVVTSVVNADGRLFVLDLRNSSGIWGFRDAEQSCASRNARLASAEELRHAVAECFFSQCTRGWLYGGTVGSTVCDSSMKAVDVITGNATEDSTHLDAFCIKDKAEPCGEPPSFPNTRLQGRPGFEMGDELLYTCVPGYVMPSGQGAFSLLCDSCGEWYGLVQICVKDKSEIHMDFEDITDSYGEAERRKEMPAEADVYEKVDGAAYPEGKMSQDKQETSFGAEEEERHRDERGQQEVRGEVIKFEGAVEQAVQDFIGHTRWEQESREVIKTDAAAPTEAPVSLLSQKHMFWFPSEAFQEEGHPVSINPVTQSTQRASGAQSEESKEQESQERHQYSVVVDHREQDSHDDHDDRHNNDDLHDHDDRDERDDNDHHDDRDDRDDTDNDDHHHDDRDDRDDHNDQDDHDSHQDEDDHDDHVKHYIPAQHDDKKDSHEKQIDDHSDHYDLHEREDVPFGSQEYDDHDNAYIKHKSHEDHEDHEDMTDDVQEHPHGSEEHPDFDDHDDVEEHYDVDEVDINQDHKHDDHDSYEDDDDVRHRVIFSINPRQNVTQKKAGGKTTTDETWLDGYPVVQEKTEKNTSVSERSRPESQERATDVRTTDRPNEIENHKPVETINTRESELEQGRVKEVWPGFIPTAAPSPDRLNPSDSPSYFDTLDYDTQQAAPTHSWLGDITEQPFLDHGPAPPVHDGDILTFGVTEEHTMHSLPGETGERGEMGGERGEAMCTGENCPPHPPSFSSQGPKVAAIIVAVCAVAAAVIVGVWCYRRQQQKSSMYEMNGKGQSQSRQGQHIEMQQKV